MVLIALLFQIFLALDANALLITGTLQQAADLAKQYPAVGRLYTHKSDGLHDGTASLITYKGRPFILTAKHCVIDSHEEDAKIARQLAPKTPPTTFKILKISTDLNLLNFDNKNLKVNTWVGVDNTDLALGLLPKDFVLDENWPTPLSLNKKEFRRSEKFDGISVGASPYYADITSQNIYKKEDAYFFLDAKSMPRTDVPLAGPIFLKEKFGDLKTLNHTKTATNPGDSGGPILYQGGIVGLASSGRAVRFSNGIAKHFPNSRLAYSKVVGLSFFAKTINLFPTLDQIIENGIFAPDAPQITNPDSAEKNDPPVILILVIPTDVLKEPLMPQTADEPQTPLQPLKPLSPKQLAEVALQKPQTRQQNPLLMRPKKYSPPKRITSTPKTYTKASETDNKTKHGPCPAQQSNPKRLQANHVRTKKIGRWKRSWVPAKQEPQEDTKKAAGAA